MDMKNKDVLVLGAGKSGVSAVKFLLSREAVVSLYDKNQALSDSLISLEKLGVKLILGGMPKMSLGSYDLVIVSPGISMDNPTVKAAMEHRIPVWGEIELASQYITAPIIGITGTNGKTTTTALLGTMFRNAGKKTFIGGNIGVPLIEAVGVDYDIIVAELSSFQLETIHEFRPMGAVYLNLTPDHLDRHGTMEEYLRIKGRMSENQESSDFVIINYDDPMIKSLADKSDGKVIYYSQKSDLVEGICLDFEHAIVNRKMINSEIVDEHIIKVDEIYLKGCHNLENAMASCGIACAMGVPVDVIRHTLMNFKGVEHRLEEVAVINGISFVNDSKATNPDSAIKALESFGDAPIIMIAGGRNKGADFTVLGETIKKKVKHLILIGEAANDIKAVMDRLDYHEITICDSMKSAVNIGYEQGVKGDIVLLSPANASFDMYQNFEVRGNDFKELVTVLQQED